MSSTTAQQRGEGAAPGLLHRDRIIAGPGFSRWMVPPAAVCVHLCTAPGTHQIHGSVCGSIIHNHRAHLRRHFSQRLQARSDYIFRVVGNNYSRDSQK